jgi:hypothetical protein
MVRDAGGFVPPPERTRRLERLSAAAAWHGLDLMAL